MALFPSFLPFDALQIHYIVPIKHIVDTEKQLGMILLQALFLPTPPPSTFMSVLKAYSAAGNRTSPGGGTLDFKWQGRSNGGKYRNHHPKSLGLQTKKSLDQTIPKKKNPMPNSPIIKISGGTTQLGCAETIMNLHIVWIPLNTLLKSSYPEKYLPKFSYLKNPDIENFKPKKILWSSLSLEIQSIPPGHKSMKSEKMLWYISEA